MKLKYKDLCYWLEYVEDTDNVDSIIENFSPIQVDLLKIRNINDLVEENLKINRRVRFFDGLKEKAFNCQYSTFKDPDKIFELRIEIY